MNDMDDAKLLKERDITQSWVDTENDEVVVSVICITYNHSIYIERAIESILMQKTSFRYEIIVHDDASTDGTTSIVKKYAQQYPNIIRLIIQKENQFSKGGFKPPVYAQKFASGKYIALCEGDDYWIDELKLQKQKDILDSNNGNFCFSQAIEIDESNDESNIISDYGNVTDVDYRNIIIGRGASVPSASIFFRKSVFDKYLSNNLHKYKVGDFFIQSYFALTGKCYYISEPTCVYRRNAQGSWTQSMSKGEKVKFRHNVEMARSISIFLFDMKKNKNVWCLIYPVCFYYKNSLRFFLKKSTDFSTFLSLVKLTLNISCKLVLTFVFKLIKVFVR